jgi:DNA-binding transcriptional LysR family regulator
MLFLHVGLSPLVDTIRVADVANSYCRTRNGLQVTIGECPEDEIETRLGRGEIDFGVRPKTAPRETSSPFGRQPLYSEPLMFLPRKQITQSMHHIGKILISDIRHESIAVSKKCGLSAIIRKLFVQNGMAVNEHPDEVSSYKLIEACIGRGGAAGILPKSKISIGNHSARPLFVDPRRPARAVFEVVWRRRVPEPEHMLGLLRAFWAVTMASLPVAHA